METTDISGSELPVKMEKPAEDTTSEFTTPIPSPFLIYISTAGENKPEPSTTSSTNEQPATQPTATVANMLEPSELAACLKKQIEFYFSP